MFNKKFFDKNFTSLKDVMARQATGAGPSAVDDGKDVRARTAPTDAAAAAGPALPRTDDERGAADGAAVEGAPDAVPGMLSRHKGKLAIGAAAMLGLAAFYHWRESKLAKEDEEEYARLQRLKAALDVDQPPTDH